MLRGMSLCDILSFAKSYCDIQIQVYAFKNRIMGPFFFNESDLLSFTKIYFQR